MPSVYVICCINYMTDVSKRNSVQPNQTAPDLDPLCLRSIKSANICSRRLELMLFAGTMWVNMVKLTLKMPPNYKFENVVCYIYLLTLLTHVGIYANSVAASQTTPISLICIYTV